jgi:tetratricopeptide (TPR) repeat protein
MDKRSPAQKLTGAVKDRIYTGRAFRRAAIVCGLMIFLMTVLLYTPALKNNFVNLDDGAYVYDNSSVRSLSLQSARWMFTAFHAANWHPLTWLSHAIDYAFFGLNPRGHHLTSIILHGLNTLLVFLLSIHLVLKVQVDNKAVFSEPFPAAVFALLAACVTSLLFGVHPVHVESVAWVAERKDVLCAFFFLLTLVWYCFFVSAADKQKRAARFAAGLALAAAALMAKPMAVTLPLILILLDIYPFRRISLSANADRNLPVLMEKVPFLLLSSISAILTVLAQHAGGAFESFERLPFSVRLANALFSPLFYLAKMLWPTGLVPYYAFPQTINTVKALYYGISGIVTLGVTGACIWQWRRGKHLFLIVWAYYLITLLPVAGIVQVGSQAAADRYTYLPGVGIFLLAGLGVARICTSPLLRRFGIIYAGLIGVLIVTAFAPLTIKQIAIWRDSETLWQYVINTFPGRVPIAHNNLGVLYDGRGLHDEALEEYKKALAINPTFADALNNLGVAYKRKGSYDMAIQAYEKALARYPNFAEARNNLGLAYYTKGMYDQAVEQYEKALEINPSFAEAHYRLGLAHYEKQNYALAKSHVEKAQQLGYEVDEKLAELIKRAP